MNVGDILVSTLRCEYHGLGSDGEQRFGHKAEVHAYEVVALDMNIAVLREVEWIHRGDYGRPEPGRYIGDEKIRRPILDWKWGEYVEWPMSPERARPLELAALWHHGQRYPAYMIRNARQARRLG